MIKLGKLDQTTSFEQKDKIMVRECRIIYKRRSPAEPLPAGQFSAMSSVNPRFYIDPNEMVRRQNAETLAKTGEMLAKNSAAAKRSSDLEVQKATASSTGTGPQQALAVGPSSAINSLQPTTIILQPVAIGTHPAPDW